MTSTGENTCTSSNERTDLFIEITQDTKSRGHRHKLNPYPLLLISFTENNAEAPRTSVSQELNIYEIVTGGEVGASSPSDIKTEGFKLGSPNNTKGRFTTFSERKLALTAANLA